MSSTTNSNEIADTSILTFNGTGANAGTFQTHFSRTETVGGLVSTGGAGVVENGANLTAFLNVGVNNTPRDFSGILQNGSGGGAFGLIKSGNAAQTLSGSVANTYTGKTTVNSGTLILNKTAGVNAISSTGASGNGNVANTDLQIAAGGAVQLGANNQIANTTKVGLSGGILDLNGFSEGSPGVNGVGALTLSATSTIDFGLGASSIIQFAGVDGQTNNTVLQIMNWNGVPVTGGAGDRLLFAGDPSEFSSFFQQSEVRFNGGATGYGLVDFSGYYEVTGLTPVPEPGTWAAGALTAAFVAQQFFARRKKQTAKS